MRMERSLAGLVLWTLVICSGCNLIDGPEGTYTIDRERTREGFERYALQTFTQLVGEEKANSNEFVAERKKMQEETFAVVDQISLELHLERGGKFHGQTKLGEVGRGEPAAPAALEGSFSPLPPGRTCPAL